MRCDAVVTPPGSTRTNPPETTSATTHSNTIGDPFSNPRESFATTNVTARESENRHATLNPSHPAPQPLTNSTTDTNRPKEGNPTDPDQSNSQEPKQSTANSNPPNSQPTTISTTKPSINVKLTPSQIAQIRSLNQAFLLGSIPMDLQEVKRSQGDLIERQKSRDRTLASLATLQEKAKSLKDTITVLQNKLKESTKEMQSTEFQIQWTTLSQLKPREKDCRELELEIATKQAIAKYKQDTYDRRKKRLEEKEKQRKRKQEEKEQQKAQQKKQKQQREEASRKLCTTENSDEVMIVEAPPKYRTSNNECPITGKEMIHRVRNHICGHIYSREGVLQLLRLQHQRDGRRKGKVTVACPIAGCCNHNVCSSQVRTVTTPISTTNENERHIIIIE